VSDANVYIGRPMLLAVITPESSNVSPDFLDEVTSSARERRR